MKDDSNSSVLRLVGLVVFIVTFSIGFVLYQTVLNESPPIEDVTVDYSFVKTKDFIIVTSSNTTEANDDFSANVSRILTDKETGYQIELHAGDVDYEPGVNNIHRIFYLPLSTPNGTYCVKTIMRWRPDFSLIDKKTVFKNGCFTING